MTTSISRIAFGITVCCSLLFSGCGGHDFLKQVEGRAYDAIAKTMSEYCARTQNVIVSNERLELRREVRQRGSNGPDAVQHPGLDEKTGGANGPVIRIWCKGESVPQGVWDDLVR